MNEFFPLFFMTVMGAAVLAYVVLDGYDLGVGMLMPAASEDEQSIMVASIGPFGDANETWLVLGIGVLLAAFPLAHGIVLGALYLPVVAMLVGIMFRGVAFELRTKAHGWHRDKESRRSSPAKSRYRRRSPSCKCDWRRPTRVHRRCHLRPAPRR